MTNNNKVKGVSKTKSGSYEAYVTVKNTGKRSKTVFKAHVGTFKTPQEAVKARMDFINNLK